MSVSARAYFAVAAENLGELESCRSTPIDPCAIASTIFCNYTRARGARRFRTLFSFLCLTGEIEPTRRGWTALADAAGREV